MEQDNVKWKYNAAKHEVVEQPTWTEADFVKSIPVSGKVYWADGEDVTGKFRIGKGHFIDSKTPNEPKEFAIPIKQEQPQERMVGGSWLNNPQSQEQDNVIGVEWVKASERLPKGVVGKPKELASKWHFETGNTQIRGTTVWQFLDAIKIMTDLSKVEWLDESAISPLLQQNKELQKQLELFSKSYKKALDFGEKQRVEFESRIQSLSAANAFHKQAAHQAIQEQYRLQKEVMDLRDNVQFLSDQLNNKSKNDNIPF